MRASGQIRPKEHQCCWQSLISLRTIQPSRLRHEACSDPSRRRAFNSRPYLFHHGGRARITLSRKRLKASAEIFARNFFFPRAKVQRVLRTEEAVALVASRPRWWRVLDLFRFGGRDLTTSENRYP